MLRPPASHPTRRAPGETLPRGSPRPGSRSGERGAPRGAAPGCASRPGLGLAAGRARCPASGQPEPGCALQVASLGAGMCTVRAAVGAAVPLQSLHKD